MPQVARVAVADATIHYDTQYSYTVPPRLWGHIFVGSMVLVPFGRGKSRPRLGVVMALEEADEAGTARLKELEDAAPQDAALTDELLAIVEYLREYTFCTWFEAVRAVLPRGAQYAIKQVDGAWRLVPKMAGRTEVVYRRLGDAPEGTKLTAKQRAVLDLLESGEKSREEIAAGCGAGAAVAEKLAEKGLVEKATRPKETPLFAVPPQDAAPLQGYALSAEQQRVTDELSREMEADKPKPVLLHGVTASGKTEVFIALIQKALAQGKTALVLVPEIGLTPQMVARLRTAFGGRVALLHSALSHGERMTQWKAIRAGELPVVVGTRSAVFAPLEKLGLVVVDEEQEHTYQSESAPRYNAVEVARRRAQRHGALLLLASATPSVASYYAAQHGRYRLLTLSERYGNLPLPAVEMADMAAEQMAGNVSAISRQLAGAMRREIEAGGQVILLLNRRGYHRLALCRECGAAVKCEDCSVPMVLHRGARGTSGAFPQAKHANPMHADGDPDSGAPETWEHSEREREDFSGGYLMCHHCKKVHSPAPQVCPECGGQLRYAGFGTQKLEEDIAEMLPGVRVLRMDTDTTQQKGAHARMLEEFAAGRYDVLLGTQMVAKGLDFEKVRLVGVIGIDSLLFAQGYRAYEHVFSLVTQVVGRSGRRSGGGRAIIQTADVQNPVLALAAKQDYPAFYEEEIAFRKLAFYPPFCTVCIVGFAAGDEQTVAAAARRFAALLAQRAKQLPNLPLRVLGPVPMPVVHLAGSWRWKLTLKCRADDAFRRLARQVLEDYNKEGWARKASVWLDFNSDV